MRKNLIEEFDRCWKRYPEKTAVACEAEEISFEQLAEKAIALAGIIVDRLDGVRNVPVAVFMPKCTNVVVSDLAIAYSSNIFMNLDIKLPAARLQNILANIRPAMIVTSGKAADVLQGLDIPIVNLDLIDLSAGKNSETHTLLLQRLYDQLDTDPFCIINTSGSTGTPKGVVLSHHSFFDFYDWSIETFHFDGSEVIGSLSPVVFDHYVYELCSLILSGATIVLLDAGLAVFPARLLEALVKHKVNFIFWVPTIMVNIANLDLLRKIDVSCLRMIWFAGEVFPTRAFNYWYQNLKNVTFVNLYGPAETTVDVTYYIVDHAFSDDEPLPIGYPCHNTDILLLNDMDQACAVNETGEICVRGSALAKGYYNNPEKTAAAFVQNPLNQAYPELIYRTGDLAYRDSEGRIMFKGRKDSLIKHMGYRIELGEIEHIAVNTLKLVSNCCVVYNKAKKAITMIYEGSGTELGLPLKKALGQQLPRYMVPADYIHMDLLPRNTNGKIDRLKLTQMVNENSI